jgi:hypothetical protein
MFIRIWPVRLMRYVAFTAIVFLYMDAVAQVPGKPQQSGAIFGDIALPGTDDGPASKNAGYYQKNGKYGFVYPADVKQEAIYDNIRSGNNVFIVKKGDLYGITDHKGILISKIEYESIEPTNEDALVVKINEKYGRISNDGKLVLSIKYHKILYTGKSTVSVVEDKNGNKQLIYNSGEKQFLQNISYAAFYSNLAIVKANGKFGIIKDQTVVPFEYDSIFISSPERALLSNNVKKTAASGPRIFSNSYITITALTLQKDNKYGLVNSNGTIIYPAVNDAVLNAQSLGYFTVKKGNLYGIYFINSKTKTDIEFDRVYADGIGYVMAIKNKKSGVFDLQGKQIIPFEYEPGSIMQSRLGLRVTKDGKRGIINKSGQIIIPPVYDDVDPFYENDLNDLIQVKNKEKYGVINLQGKIIVPVEFDWIGEEKGLLKVVTPINRRFGLYDKTGKVVVKPEFKWITDSDAENSNLVILKKDEHSFNFLNKNTRQALFTENVSGYGYVLDEQKLLNPNNSSHKYLLYVKNRGGKTGMLNELTGALDIPMVYDDITQQFELGKDIFFSVKKDGKFGLISDKNKVVIPAIYEAIDVDLVSPDYNSETTYAVTAIKGKRFGTVNMQNQVQIPFQYTGLKRIAKTGLYKAKAGNYYQIIDAKNTVLNKGPFDAVTNFEQQTATGAGRPATYQALTFFNGKMRVVDSKGKFVTDEISMTPHTGYQTFDELKFALVKALDDTKDEALRDFANKVAPSDHLLYYLKYNIFDERPLRYADVTAIKEKYYQDLLAFKQRYWNDAEYVNRIRESLAGVTDYTLYRKNYVTNVRRTDHAFGGNRLMEQLLRDAVKVNGYWISSYFMQRNFDR